MVGYTRRLSRKGCLLKVCSVLKVRKIVSLVYGRVAKSAANGRDGG